ncbi:hypothetical protein PCASD_17851 [Puccinia coronata f. sp. avenae]|uniref:Uncharacterized protein n=1 Tax=Puccinia coronata f. sp. avenae TaxID=200324 RepID=A0A2N5TQC1_9BASI|nr:hypothetical protein PCASD_17851 [Puccinia coronata f. sp. avenae]
MTESTNNPITTPLQSTHSVPKSIRRQRGLIYQTFQSLVSKFEINPTRDIADILSHLYIGSIDIDEETWNKAVNQLRFDILPLLRQQINALPTLMNPLELEDDIDGSRLKLIVEIQSGLNQNSDQILSIVAGIKPELIASPRPPQADDSHLQELKEFRRQGLWYKLDSLKHQLRTIYERCAFTIRDLKKSTKAISHSHQTRKLNHRHEIIRRTINATESIDIFMKWLTSHEFINVQEEWDPEVSGLDDELAKLTKRIHRTINDPELQDDDFSSDVAILNKNIIPLAQSLIPVIKLSRLFFKKLMKDGLNKRLIDLVCSSTSVSASNLVGISASVSVIVHPPTDIYMEGSSMDSALVDVAFASAASGMDEDEPRPSPIKPKKLTESTNTPATTPSQSSKATRLVPKSILEQRLSIYHTFRNLQSNCISFPIVCDGNSREAWTKAVDKLQFDILPSLRQQISHLPKLLNPSEILQDDIHGSLLKTIIEIQSGLGENNGQILSISSQLQNNLIESAPRTDDKDFKGLKQFRLEGVSHELESLGVQLTYIFDLGAETLIEFTKSDSTKAARYWHPIRILNHTNEIMDYTTEATAIIDNVLEWLPRSEFIDIQEGWNVGLFDHGREIIKLTQFINRTISYPELKDNDCSLQN